MTPSKVTWKPRPPPAVKPDLTQSVKWLRKAANKGHAEAKRLLETVLVTAKGVH